MSISNLSVLKGGVDPVEKEREYKLLKSIAERVRVLESEISYIERDVKKCNNEDLKSAFNIFRLNTVQCLKISIDSSKKLELDLMNKVRKRRHDHLKVVNDDYVWEDVIEDFE